MKDQIEPLAWLENDEAFSYLDNLKRKGSQIINAEVNRIASHLHLVNLNEKRIVSQRVWQLFEMSYAYVGGFHSYTDFENMASEAKYIRCVYDGPLTNIEDFNVEKCYAVATYNSNHGLKMTSLASRREMEYIKRRAALRKLQQESFKFSWFECSDKAEDFVLSCGGAKLIIDPNIIKEKIYPDRDIEIDEDGFHYYRVLTQSGKRVKKLAVGKIKY